MEVPSNTFCYTTLETAKHVMEFNNKSQKYIKNK